MPTKEDKAPDADRLAEEYRSGREEFLATHKRNTSDAGDPSFGWTVQSGVGIDETAAESRGPQRYTPEQLPDPAVARAAGLAPQNIPSSLIVEGDDAFSHPRGPEAGEQERAEKRTAVTQRLVENADTVGDTLAIDAAAVSESATSAHGKALQARAAKRSGSGPGSVDESGNVRDPEGAQEDSREDAKAKGKDK